MSVYIKKDFDSSIISAVEYRPHNLELAITFVNSGLYYYRAVPEYIYFGLIEAKSAGTYFNRNIRNVYSKKRWMGV